MFSSKSLPLGFLVVVLLSCQRNPQPGANLPKSDTLDWSYPIHLGDDRSNVHKLLGPSSRVTSNLEEYPQSGLTVWYDQESHVSKLNFAGDAAAVYGSTYSILIPSDKHILQTLTAKSDVSAFKKVFGEPKLESTERSTSNQELRCIWREHGFLIDALFLNVDRNVGAKVFKKGTLVWVEVSRAL
jgi:hypothetical protein